MAPPKPLSLLTAEPIRPTLPDRRRMKPPVDYALEALLPSAESIAIRPTPEPPTAEPNVISTPSEPVPIKPDWLLVERKPIPREAWTPQTKFFEILSQQELLLLFEQQPMILPTELGELNAMQFVKFRADLIELLVCWACVVHSLPKPSTEAPDPNLVASIGQKEVDFEAFGKTQLAASNRQVGNVIEKVGAMFKSLIQSAGNV